MSLPYHFPFWVVAEQKAILNAFGTKSPPKTLSLIFFAERGR